MVCGGREGQLARGARQSCEQGINICPPYLRLRVNLWALFSFSFDVSLPFLLLLLFLKRAYYVALANLESCVSQACLEFKDLLDL